MVHQDRCAMKVTTDACLFGAWVARQIQQKSKIEPDVLLDIGTGTGLLSLMLAQKNPGLEIHAIEIDPMAAGQAADNFHLSPWVQRISLFHADVRQYQFQRPYSIIVSNPPFYENELSGPNRLKNLAHHQEGLLLKELFGIIQQNLGPDGRFYLLLPFKRKAETEALIQQFGFSISKLLQVKQSPAHGYFRIMIEAKQFKLNSEITEIKELIISDKENMYSKNFSNLLKDYYLNL